MPAFVEHFLFDRDEWRRIIAEQVEPILSETLRDGGKRGVAIAEQIGFTGAFDVENPEVRAWLEGYHFKFADKISATASDQLRTVLEEGLHAGEGLRELKQRILNDPVIGPASDAYRAEMIARTETTRAQEAGAEQAWINANREAAATDLPQPFTKEVWRANKGACPFCAALEGRVTDFGEAYFQQGSTHTEGGITFTFNYETVERPPAHPNCACGVEPVVNEYYQTTAIEEPVRVSTELERDSTKSQVADLDILYPSSMSNEARRELQKFEVISKSPYSDSFYDITNKSWNDNPIGSLRLSDHWNFESQGVLHEITLPPPSLTSWTLARLENDGYHIIKSWPKLNEEGQEAMRALKRIAQLNRAELQVQHITILRDSIAGKVWPQDTGAMAQTRLAAMGILKPVQQSGLTPALLQEVPSLADVVWVHSWDTYMYLPSELRSIVARKLEGR